MSSYISHNATCTIQLLPPLHLRQRPRVLSPVGGCAEVRLPAPRPVADLSADPTHSLSRSLARSLLELWLRLFEAEGFYTPSAEMCCSSAAFSSEPLAWRWVSLPSFNAWALAEELKYLETQLLHERSFQTDGGWKYKVY